MASANVVVVTIRREADLKYVLEADSAIPNLQGEGKAIVHVGELGEGSR